MIHQNLNRKRDMTDTLLGFVKSKLETAQKAQFLAKRARLQDVVPGAESVATAVMTCEWRRDELLEEAAVLGAESFRGYLATYPSLVKRARELGLLKVS